MTPNTLHADVDAHDSTQNEMDNVFDPKRLRLSQNFTATVGVKKRITVIQVRKPGKQEFIRVHPSTDYCIETAILEFKEEGETYTLNGQVFGFFRK